MLNDSTLWKDQISENCSRLKNHGPLSHDEDQEILEIHEIEKIIFINFYAIRKLYESLKITDATRDKKIELLYSPRIKKGDSLFCHPSEIYDLDKKIKQTKTVQYLCNQFIHSKSFIINLDEENYIDGFYINSDRSSLSKIYYVQKEHLIEVYEAVVNDQLNRITFHGGTQNLKKITIE